MSGSILIGITAITPYPVLAALVCFPLLAFLHLGFTAARDLDRKPGPHILEPYFLVSNTICLAIIINSINTMEPLINPSIDFAQLFLFVSSGILIFWAIELEVNEVLAEIEEVGREEWIKKLKTQFSHEVLFGWTGKVRSAAGKIGQDLLRIRHRSFFKGRGDL